MFCAILYGEIRTLSACIPSIKRLLSAEIIAEKNDVISKFQEKAQELSENYDMVPEKNKAKYIAGSIVSGIGKVGASMIPAALIAAFGFGVGAWGLGLGAVMAASLLAGTALWWLGDKIKDSTYSSNGLD